MTSATDYDVVVIGAGPAGVGAVCELARAGVQSITIVERRATIGGIPALYAKSGNAIPTVVRWSRGGVPQVGADYAAWLAAGLSATGAHIRQQCQVVAIDPATRSVELQTERSGTEILHARAIILATGARERTASERGWIVGARPGRVYQTMHLLRLMSYSNVAPIRRPVVVGSDVMAYAIAAKLQHAGGHDVLLIDRRKRPAAKLHERLYFARWSRPRYIAVESGNLEVHGRRVVTSVRIDETGDSFECDGVVLAGSLVPNSELALLGGIEITLPSRRLPTTHGCQLSAPGWFVAGNALGGFHGAEWCYFNGRRVARSVTHFLTS